MLRTICLSHPARSLLYNFYFKDNLTDGAGFFSYQSSLMGVIRIQQEQAARSEYQVKQSLSGHLLPVSFRIIIPFFHIGQKVIVDALPSFKNQMHIVKFPMTFFMWMGEKLAGEFARRDERPGREGHAGRGAAPIRVPADRRAHV